MGALLASVRVRMRKVLDTRITGFERPKDELLEVSEEVFEGAVSMHLLFFCLIPLYKSLESPDDKHSNDVR